MILIFSIMLKVKYVVINTHIIKLMDHVCFVKTIGPTQHLTRRLKHVDVKITLSVLVGIA